MVQTDDGPLPTLVILRLTVESSRPFAQDVVNVGSAKHKTNLEANRLNGSDALSPEKQYPITMAATCEFAGKIMAYASKALLDTTMVTAVQPFAQTVSYSHFALKNPKASR